jgi:hypothetical protein
MNGRGSWQVAGGALRIRWFNSQTTEEWDIPLDSKAATGKCKMAEGTFDLSASALDFYLAPGDVIYSGEIVRRTNYTRATIIYNDWVKSGGTVAWICNNPGNIRDGSEYGAFKDRQLHIPGAGAFAIFPDDDVGLEAVVKLLRVYGRVTILQAIHKWAPKGDGSNNPDAYAKRVCDTIGLPSSTYLPTLSDDQLLDMAQAMTKVEESQIGKVWRYGDPEIPFDIRQRL